MRSFTIATTVILAATSTFAAPLNSTLHFFGKRDAVCGLDFRALVNKGDCIPTGVKFTLTPPSTINKVTLTVRTFPFCIAWSSPNLLHVVRAMNSRPVLLRDSVVSFSLRIAVSHMMLITVSIREDHLVELQLLDSVAQRSGICAIMTALVAADATQSKAKLLAKASTDISALKNLNFLEATANNRVR